MKTLVIPVAVLMSQLIAGCATPLQYSGESTADPTLKSDIARLILNPFRVRSTCEKIDGIETKVTEVRPPIPGDPSDLRRLGSVTETWTVNACGQLYAHRVLIAPSPKGGTDFVVSRWPR